MFEDFRKQVEEAALAAETQEEEPEAIPVETEGYFLGMTPMQRFIVASMLLVLIIILGGLFLVITQKVSLPFLS